jgi:mannosyltransferase
MREELMSENGRRTWRLAVGGELLLGGVLGTIFLGSHSLFLDESVSASLATTSWHRFTEVVAHREPNMSLYYLLMRGWAFFGHGEAALRTLSVLAGIGALAAVIMVARSLFGERAALICGLLLATNPLFVEFAQDVRGYSLCLLLVSASSLLFVRGIQHPQSRPWLTWVGYTLVSVLAAYSNFWAAMVPLSHAASLAFLPRRLILWRRLVPVGGAMLVLLVPMALLIRSTDSSGVQWAAGSSAGHLITRIRGAVPHSLLDLGALFIVFALFGTVLLIRRRPAAMAAIDRGWGWIFTASWLVVPLAAIVILSVIYMPLLVIRYVMVSVPPAAILTGALVDRALRPAGRVNRLGRSAAIAIFAVLLGSSAAATLSWYRSSGLQDWRGVVSYVGAQTRPGDGVLFVAPYGRIPFEWYVVQHPQWSATLHPVYPSLTWGIDPLRFDSSPSMSQRDVARAAAKYQRVWLVQSDQKFTPRQETDVLAALRQDGYSAGGARVFRGVQVVEEVHSGTP